jgi:hypothetical protein
MSATITEFGVMVEDAREREYIKDDKGRLTAVHDTGCFQITPLESHVSGFSPRQGSDDRSWFELRGYEVPDWM